MNMALTPAELLCQALTSPARGLPGMVDDLLEASRSHPLYVDWHAGNCRVWFPRTGPQAPAEVPLRKSVFRAALARIAVLCNQRAPHSVDPYGGRGEITHGTDPVSVIRVRFTNTPHEQSLELTPALPDASREDVVTAQAVSGASLHSRPDAAGMESGASEGRRQY